MAATVTDGNRATTQIVNTDDGVPVAYLEGQLVNARKQKLHTVEWLPSEGNPVAIVLFHHGLGEHIARYNNVFPRFAASGVAVYALDAHGHGKSEPQERAYINDFFDLVADYEQRLAEIKEAYSSANKQLPPVFVAGHSLGGLVAAHTAARNPKHFAGLILHSAAIDVEWNLVMRLQASVGNLLAAIMPHKPLVPAVRPEDMSPDPKVVKDYIEDPAIYHGNVKARTANTSLKAFIAMQRQADKLDLPLYVAHGTQDRCTSIKAAKRLYEVCPNKDKVFREVEGGYHELLHGPEKEESAKAIITWVLERAKPRASL